MRSYTWLSITFLFLTLSLSGQSENVNKQVFDLLDLNHPGLENVSKLYSESQYEEAMQALLSYYKQRSGIIHPDIDLDKLKISKEEQKYADEALEHKFFSHKGYQPSYFYGDDINWKFWPIQDNELRWQLHRHKWFVPMGKAYRISGDEKYAKQWIYQYVDWIKKNPYPTRSSKRQSIPSIEDATTSVEEDRENSRFAWRPLEVSHRLQDQTAQFLLFSNSKHFTPAFCSEFLVNYHRHATHIMGNFSASGNHLLFEAQRVLYAGIFFPEFKDAPNWRKRGIDILNEQMGEQVYADGVQFELCPHYHLASIGIFIKAGNIAAINGYQKEFPSSYYNTIERMIEAEYNLSFPDYSNPMFSDSKRNDAKGMIRSYKQWSKLFPNNKNLPYFATEGQQGERPNYLSKGFMQSGFFVMRTGWDSSSTVMMVKAGPPAFWHNQPDNGTFELYIKGRNFFPDAGAYVYAGDAEVMKWRNWFRQTMVHKTLTLNNKDLETTDSKTLLWSIDQPTEILVTQNQSYKELKHRRSIFFVNKEFFVIVDEAVGDAIGEIELHYQMCEGEMAIDKKNNSIHTLFADGNNIMLQSISNIPSTMQQEQGWVSYEYRQKNKREAFSFVANKTTTEPVRYITVITPISSTKKLPKIQPKFVNAQFDEKGLQIKVKVGSETFQLGYDL